MKLGGWLRWLISLGLMEAVRAYYVASFAGCFLPSTVGADAMRVAAVSGPQRPSAAVAASVVVERALGFVAAACASLVSLGLLAGLALELPPGVRTWSLAILGASVLAVAVTLSGPLAAWLEGLALLFTRVPISVSGFGLVGLNSTHSFLLVLVANLSVLVATLPGAWFYARGGLKQQAPAGKDRPA
ncbi:MAG: hypothetical protein HY910_08485 [Desulfarculus sp.]|nr:hypothetical protein [Desulfarculus sp.]